ncbi:MAG: Gfo/Idh/MocA family oxidoreductase, partial [Staphylococcus equorum]|nr:Gfo/Idh/MocA family oxidoreductase [Staphylococcus equorum]
IKTGIIGLGRLGKIHAENLVEHIPDIELVSACSVIDDELAYAKNVLKVSKTFKDFNAMIDEGGLDAVVIVSPSGYHTEQVRYAMEAGLHVFTEKPLGVNLPSIEKILPVVDAHPNQVFQLGFMRRYDESYRYAKELIENGKIGEVTFVRTYGIDPSEGLESFVNFAKNSSSGGIFLDMAIHDIDLVRWFTNKEPKKGWAIGNNVAYPELEELNETETSAAMIQLEDNVMAVLVNGRNASHGYHVETEIMGTKGMLRVANSPEKNLVTIYDDNGVVRPTSQNFPERFKQAFINEMLEFASCIKNSKQPEVKAKDGYESTKIALALQESYENNKMISI